VPSTIVIVLRPSRSSSSTTNSHSGRGPDNRRSGKRLRAAGLDVGRSSAPWWTMRPWWRISDIARFASAPFDVYVAFSSVVVCCGRPHDPHECPARERCARRPARLRQISPDGVIDVASMEQVVAAHEAPWRTNLLFFALFGGVTVLLAGGRVVCHARVKRLGAISGHWCAPCTRRASRRIGPRRPHGRHTCCRCLERSPGRWRDAWPPAASLVHSYSRYGRLIRPCLSPSVTTVLAVTAIACAFPAWRAARVDAGSLPARPEMPLLLWNVAIG